MAISISITISQGFQSVENNTTVVTAKVVAKWTYGSWSGYSKPGYLIIDGTKYPFSSTFNTGRSTSGSATLYTASKTVTHASNGTKTVSCSASYTSGVSSGTVTASNSKTLTTIPRKSSLTVANGTLDTAQMLTIKKLSSGFNHKLTYACGSISGYILGSSSATSSTLSQSWKPPLDLAAQNTSGTSVSITFKLYTYSDSTQIGSNSYTKTFEIPDSVKPSCSIAVSDQTGYETTYGGYLKGLSRINVEVTGTPDQGSDIASYSTTANGSTYTSSAFTTSELKSAGKLIIASKVTDKRGRFGTNEKEITVLDYNGPSITGLKVKRCNSNGDENIQGDHLQIMFNSSVTSINDIESEFKKNTATYILEYKKSSDNSYGDPVKLTDYTDNFKVLNGSCVFYADIGSSYDIRLTVTDDFKSDVANTKASTAFTLMHWLKSGLGMAIGKIAEIEEYLDIGFKTRFRKNIVMNQGAFLYGEDPTTGANIIAFQPQNESGNVIIGYGNYTRKSGNTNLYSGNNFYMISSQSSTAIMALYGETGRINMYRQNDIGINLKHSSSGKGIGIGVGAGGDNRGIWDPTSGNWIIHRNSANTTVVTQTSDARLKENLGEIPEEEMRALLSGMQPINFIYKNDENRVVQNGFIAQNVRDILIDNDIGYRSYLQITEEQEELYDLNAPEEDVKYGLDYSKFTPLLVAGWQYHEKKIKELEDRVRELEEKMKVSDENG